LTPAVTSFFKFDNVTTIMQCKIFQ
jgi:hypothetical protein